MVWGRTFHLRSHDNGFSSGRLSRRGRPPTATRPRRERACPATAFIRRGGLILPVRRFLLFSNVPGEAGTGIGGNVCRFGRRMEACNVLLSGRPARRPSEASLFPCRPASLLPAPSPSRRPPSAFFFSPRRPVQESGAASCPKAPFPLRRGDGAPAHPRLPP